MSDNLPATRTPLDEIARLGQWLAASEGSRDPKGADGMTAALRIYYARELGLTPLAAAELHPRGGNLIVGAKLIRARAAQYGYRVLRDPKSDAKSATARLVKRDTGEEVGETTFTMDDAKAAGIVRPNGGWEKYPARMLWARASKYVVDDFAPEASLGLVLEDEAAEITGEVTAESFDDDEPKAPLIASGGHGEVFEPDPAGFEEEQTSFEPPKGKRGEGA